MRKSLCIFSILLVSAFFVLISCGGDPAANNGNNNTGNGAYQAGEMSKFVSSMSGIENLKANISSTTSAIGMQQTEATSRSIEDYTEKTAVLVKLDEGSANTEPITYTVVGEESVDLNGEIVTSGTVITQDKIPGTLDKVYVSGDFTFVSYLTVDIDDLINSPVTSFNESGSNGGNYTGSMTFGSTEYLNYFAAADGSFITLTYTNYEENITYSESIALRCEANDYDVINEDDSVSYHDLQGYYTSIFKQSFIIDNRTGLIYDLRKPESSGKNIKSYNFSIYNGIPFEKDLGPVSLSVNEKNELVVEQLVPNSQIFVKDIFRDKYGNTYVLNKEYDEKPSSDHIYFTTPGEYLPTLDGRVIHITFAGEDESCVESGDFFTYGTNRIKSVKLIDNNVEKEIGNDETIEIRHTANNDDNRYTNGIAALGAWRSKSDTYWDKKLDEKGSLHYFSRVENGVLYSTYRNGSSGVFVFGSFDMSKEETQLFIFNNNHWAFKEGFSFNIQLNDEYILVAEEGNSMPVYIISPYVDDPKGFLKVILSPGHNGNLEDLKNRFYEANTDLNPYEYSPEAQNRLNDYLLGVSLEGADIILNNVTVNHDTWRNLGRYQKMIFQVRSINGNESYKVVWDEDLSKFKAVLASTYVAEKKTVSLQPINW